MTLNKYCQALAALRSQPAHELREVGDQWRTPDLLFWGINSLFGPLVLDLFADDDNAKCPAWYTAEDNALTQDWSERLAELGGAGYGNPPYRSTCPLCLHWCAQPRRNCFAVWSCRKHSKKYRI